MKDLQRLEAQTKLLEHLSWRNKNNHSLPHWVRERFDTEQNKWIWEFTFPHAIGAQHISEIAKYL